MLSDFQLNHILVEDLWFTEEFHTYQKKLSELIETSMCLLDSNLNFVKVVALNFGNGNSHYDLFQALKEYNYDLVEEYLDYQYHEFYYDKESQAFYQIDLSLIFDLDMLADILISTFNDEERVLKNQLNLH